MKDPYFDSLVSSNHNGEIKLYETQPLNIPNTKGEDQKQWLFNNEFPQDLLYEKGKIDSIVSSIEWKKRRTGLLIRNNRAHWLLTNEITENFHDTLSKEILRLPEFFDRALFNYYNAHSRIFEDASSVYS